MSDGVVRVAAESLSVGYRERVALSDVSFSLRAGELIALVGPNGVGKTTLLRTLAGLMPALSGRAVLTGVDVSTFSAAERGRRLAFLPQVAPAAWPFTVKELVSQGRFPHRGWFGPERQGDRVAIDSAIARAGLGGFEDRLVTELSGGELQRALIARSIAQDPLVLLLDEPVSQLDVKYQVSAMDLLRSLVDGGLAAAVTLHDLNLAGLYADTIALFAKGRLSAIGTPSQVLQEDILRDAFDSSMLVGEHPRSAGTPLVYHPSPPSRGRRG